MNTSISNENYYSYSNNDIKSIIRNNIFEDIYDTLYTNLIIEDNKHDDSLLFEFEEYVLSNYEELEDEEKKKIDSIVNKLYDYLFHL